MASGIIECEFAQRGGEAKRRKQIEFASAERLSKRRLADVGILISIGG
jgi:hypothetical protein